MKYEFYLFSVSGNVTSARRSYKAKYGQYELFLEIPGGYIVSNILILILTLNFNILCFFVQPIYVFDLLKGIQVPRQTDASGNKLRSARAISNIISENRPSSDTTDDDPVNTIALPAFGQFLDHDITITPMSSGTCGSIVKIK